MGAWQVPLLCSGSHVFAITEKYSSQLPSPHSLPAPYFARTLWQGRPSIISDPFCPLAPYCLACFLLHGAVSHCLLPIPHHAYAPPPSLTSSPPAPSCHGASYSPSRSPLRLCVHTCELVKFSIYARTCLTPCLCLLACFTESHTMHGHVTFPLTPFPPTLLPQGSHWESWSELRQAHCLRRGCEWLIFADHK